MEIIVLSMHRSGSSMVTRLINMMGAYFGPPDIETRANSENPKGFWERRDVRALNDEILHSVYCDWDYVSNFSIKKVADRFSERVGEIVKELNSHKSWVVKEPRLCLLLPLWLPLLASPVLVIPYRNPLEIASSLYVRNKIPVPAGIALWELYSIEILKLARSLPHIFVDFELMVKRPLACTESLYEKLYSFDSMGLNMADSQEVEDFVDASLYRQKINSSALNYALNPQQHLIWNAYKNNVPAEAATALRISKGGYEALRAYETMVRPIRKK